MKVLNKIKKIFTGIFGYLNYLTPRTRQFILDNLIKGLQRLEYRGYDSAGVAFDVGQQDDQGNPKIKYIITVCVLCGCVC